MSKDAKRKTSVALKLDLTSLPALPEGWCWTTVGEIGHVQLGRQRSPQHHNGPHMRPYLRVANVYEDRIDLSDVLEMNFSPDEYETYCLRYGDVLLNEGQSLEWVGRPAMYRDELPGACFQNTLVRFRAREGVCPAYALFLFRYYLHSQRFQRIAKWTVNIAHLGAQRFSEVEFPLAPTNEQRRIVAKIEEHFSDLDAAVAALTRARANLKRYRASIFKSAVEGRLTENWRAKNPPKESAALLLQRILKERRRKWEAEQCAEYAKAGKQPPANLRDRYNEPVRVDDTSLPALPEGWCWASVDQVSQFTRYGSSAKASGDISGVPVVRMGNIQDGQLDLSDLKYLPSDHSEFPDLLLRAGDLLFNRTNSAELVGKSAVYRGEPDPCSYASYLIAVRLIAGCESRYLSYFINSHHGRLWVASVVSQQVGQANVNGTKLRAMVFPLPPTDEQGQIVAEVERRLSIVEEVEGQLDVDTRRASRLREAILRRAFEGTLVPQDPTDEPASKLLERIRAGREANGKIKQPVRKQT